MGFPWNFEETFEGGTRGNFDSESDTGNRLDFPGPAELAADGQGIAPFRGAYCMRVNLGKNATDAYVQELDGFDAAAGVTRYIRAMLCLSPDTQFANNGDFVWIMQLQNNSAVIEGGLILAREDDRIVLKVATGSLTAGVPYVEVPIGEWFCVEVAYAIDSGAGNDGAVTVYANGARLALLNLDQQAIAGARFGAMSQSGDLQGMLYFDQIVCDDARVHAIAGGPKDKLQRRPRNPLVHPVGLCVRR